MPGASLAQRGDLVALPRQISSSVSVRDAPACSE